MTVVKSVKTWLESCPLLDGQKLNVDFLNGEQGNFSVDLIPCEPIVKSYIGGKKLKRKLFVFATTMYYGADVRQQLDNLEFFERLEEWFENQAENQIYPNLGEDKEVKLLQITSSGYAFMTDTDVARYQTQFELQYIKEE